MPNPDFTGTVPRMRCETCEHWHPFNGRSGHAGAGTCQFPGNLDGRYDPVITITTDLTVCSNWKKKEE